MVSPDFLPPCDMRFFPREKGKLPFVEGSSLENGLSPPVSRGKNRMSQRVENRGSLISVPSAPQGFPRPIWESLSCIVGVCIGSGQEVCFCPSRPDPVRNAREQDGTRTGRDGPHLGTWMGPKHCKTKHMANLDGTTSDSGWDLDGPRIGPRRGSGWHPPETVTDF